MRYPASEKLEIIRLVEQSHLGVGSTLDKLGIRTSWAFRRPPFIAGTIAFWPLATPEKRKHIYVATIEELEHNYLFDENHSDSIINGKEKEGSFQKFFQHAVHLITTWKIITTWKTEIRTPSENFNFIFKNPADDDIYDFVYQHLPYVLLFMSHGFVGIFDRMQKMDETSKNLFHMRTILAHDLISGADERRSLSNFEQLLTTYPY